MRCVELKVKETFNPFLHTLQNYTRKGTKQTVVDCVAEA